MMLIYGNYFLNWVGSHYLFQKKNGGFGYGPVELSVLFEEFGKVLIVEPYLSTIVLSGTILDKSNYANSASLLEEITSGSSQISLAYLEDGSKNDHTSTNSNLSKSDTGYVLNGTKGLVLNGGNADRFIVSAKKKC